MRLLIDLKEKACVSRNENITDHLRTLRSKFKAVLSASERCNDGLSCYCMLLEGVDAVQVVRTLTVLPNGRLAAPGTIRGDYSMSFRGEYSSCFRFAGNR